MAADPEQIQENSFGAAFVRNSFVCGYRNLARVTQFNIGNFVRLTSEPGQARLQESLSRSAAKI
jgi:hypothetical protein